MSGAPLRFGRTTTSASTSSATTAAAASAASSGTASSGTSSASSASPKGCYLSSRLILRQERRLGFVQVDLGYRYCGHVDLLGGHEAFVGRLENFFVSIYIELSVTDMVSNIDW